LWETSIDSFVCGHNCTSTELKDFAADYTGGSGLENFNDEKVAAVTLVQKLMTNLTNVSAGASQFSVESQVEAPMSFDLNELMMRINAAQFRQGGTDFGSPLVDCYDQIEKYGYTSQKPYKDGLVPVKFCVLITDGFPQDNRMTPKMAEFCSNASLPSWPTGQTLGAPIRDSKGSRANDANYVNRTVSTCSMPNIMYHLKSLGYKIFVIFVSDDPSLQEMGKEFATRYASCERPSICPLTCGLCKKGDPGCFDDDSMVRKLTTSAKEPEKGPWISGCAGVRSFQRIEEQADDGSGPSGKYYRMSERSSYPKAPVGTYDLCAEAKNGGCGENSAMPCPFFFGDGWDDVTQLTLDNFNRTYGAFGSFNPQPMYQRPNCSGALLGCTWNAATKAWENCDTAKKAKAGCTDSDVGKEGGWRNIDENAECIYFADANNMAALRSKLDRVVAALVDTVCVEKVIPTGTPSLLRSFPPSSAEPPPTSPPTCSPSNRPTVPPSTLVPRTLAPTWTSIPPTVPPSPPPTSPPTCSPSNRPTVPPSTLVPGTLAPTRTDSPTVPPSTTPTSPPTCSPSRPYSEW
jgi:hypothetical protein